MTTPYDAGYDLSRPTLEELRTTAERHGLALDDDDLAAFADQIDLTLASYRRLRQLPEPRPPAAYPRLAGHPPTEEANPHNAWRWRCDVEGASTGPLAGLTVALKDNICLAGVPMSNGSALLEGFVPDVDATVVQRILDAGGRIIGKATSENFGVSSGSNTAATGAVLNPRNPAYSVGGSSSGSAALLASGECDLAVGGDQGGSIRIPASLCGVVGLKPTYGLVPYTGIAPIEHTLDHVGPMARDVAGVATLLEVLAGPDGLDPRQPADDEVPSYVEKLGTSIDGLAVGVLAEGFGWPDSSDDRTDAIVREFAERINDAGATLAEVANPAHREAGHVAAPLYAEGIYRQLVHGRGRAYGTKGYHPTPLMTATGRALNTSARDLSATAKFFVLAGAYLSDQYDGRYYALAHNVARWLTDSYDDLLRQVDVLVMPTCAPEAVAQPHIEDPGIAEVFRAGFPYHLNAGAFNITGHPAISLPAGEVDGLPVGMMIVGRHFDEATVLAVASAYEGLA